MNIDLTSLILSALLADDALTCAEIASLLGVRAAALRPALRELVAAGAVVTSGRTRATRYCLALEESPVAEPVVSVPVVDVLAPVAAVLVQRSRRARPVTPAATLDLMGALMDTAAYLVSGTSLAAVNAIALDRAARGVAR